MWTNETYHACWVPPESLDCKRGGYFRLYLSKSWEHQLHGCTAVHAVRLTKHTHGASLGYKGVSIQIVYFYEPNSGGVVHTTHNRGVVTWLAASAMIADSRLSGAWPLSRISRT